MKVKVDVVLEDGKHRHKMYGLDPVTGKWIYLGDMKPITTPKQVFKFAPALVPFDATIVHVGYTDLGIQVWAEVTLPIDYSKYKPIVVIGTGQEIPMYHKHLASVVTPKYLVWHLYEANPVTQYTLDNSM